MRREGEDKLWWVHSKRRLYGVKSLYSVMSCHNGFRFPWKSVWLTKVSLRIAFFVWSATLGKIITMYNLWKWRVIVVDRCCMCKRNGEFVDHLLFHYEVAYVIWNVFLSQFGLFWVMPRRVVDLYDSWWTVGSTWSAAVWKMVPSCILWCLLREMNDKSFEDRKRTLEEIIYFSALYIFKQLLIFLLWWLVIMIFLFFLSLLVKWLILYTSCVHGGSLPF